MKCINYTTLASRNRIARNSGCGYNFMRFGEMLQLWLDYLGLSNADLAELADKHPNYIGSLKRGKSKPGRPASGIGKPTTKVKKQIFNGLHRAYSCSSGKPVVMNDVVFWDGPPAPVFQNLITKALQGKRPSPMSPSMPTELSKIFDIPHLLFEGKELTEAQKRRLYQIMALPL